MASILEKLQQQAQPQPQAQPEPKSSVLQKLTRPIPEVDIYYGEQPPMPEPKPEIPVGSSLAGGQPQQGLTPLQQRLGIDPSAAQAAQQVAANRQRIMKGLVSKAAAEADPQVAPFIRGIYSGAEGLRGTLHSLKALGAHVVDDEEALQDAAEVLMRLEAEQQVRSQDVKSVEELIANPNFSDFATWAAFRFGEQVPNIASVVAGGGLGAFAGRKIAQAKAKNIIDDITARQLERVYTDRGAKIGAFLTATGLETGATTQEQLLATGRINPLVAIGAGATKGALEIATPLAVAQRFGLGENLAGKFTQQLTDRLIRGGVARRAASGALAVAGGEAGTEAAQEVVDNFARAFVDENYDALGPEARSRILNAAAVGGLVGFAPGAVTGAFTRPQPKIGEELGAEAAAEILAPTPEFRMPGGFRRVSEPAAVSEPEVEVEAAPRPIRFERGETIDLERSATGRLQQVDVSQLDLADVSAALESLPDTVEQLKAEVKKVPRKVMEAIRTRNNALSAMFKAERGRTEGVRAQQIAREELQEAERLYEEAVTEGFRYVPPGGAEQLAREGLVYAGQAPIPETAVREVRETGFQLDPNGLIIVEGVQPQVALRKAQRGQRGRGSAFVHEGELAEHEITARPENLSRHLVDPQFSFAPRVTPEQRVELEREFREKIGPGRSAENRVADYVSLVKRGLRVKPHEGAENIALAEVPLQKLRPVPAQLEDVSKLWRFRGRFSSVNSVGNLRKSVNHKSYDPTKHRPGTVKFFFNKADYVDFETQHANFLRAVQTARELLKSMPDLKLVITSRAQTLHSVIGSHAAYYDDNFALIYLDPMNLRDKINSAHVFFHEMGHIISGHVLQRADVKHKSAIFTAWLRHLYAQQRQSASEFWLGFADAARTRDYGPGRAAIDLGRTRTAAESIADASGFQAWYQFDEWFAEQTAKWAATPGTKATDIVERFFKGIFERLRKLVESIRKHYNLGEPEFSVDAAVRDYLDSVVQRPQTGHQATIYPFAEEPLVDDQGLPSQASFGTYITRAAPEASEVGPSRARVAEGVDKYAWYVRWGWNIVQMAQKNPHISGLQRYVERVRAWHIEKMKWISRAEERIVEWRNLGKEMAQRLSDFIWEIESMQYLGKGENARQPTRKELGEIAKKHKLNEEAAQLYNRIREDFNAVLGEIERVWIRDAAAAITDEVELGKAVNRIRSEMRALRRRPYFPHARFGDYVLSVRDGDGKLVVFRQFENKKARDDAADLARKDFPESDGYFVQTTIMPEDVRMYRGLPPSLLDNFAQRLKLTAEQQEWLEQLKFDMSPANSWAKHLKKRKGIPGWSTDAQRAYGNYFFHGANHIARLIHQNGLEAAIGEVAQSAKQMPDADRRMGITNYMRRHLDYIMHPPNEWSSVRSLGFTWLLGFAPDSAFVNITQVPLVAWPYLGARFGQGRASAALTRASKDLWKLWHQNKPLSDDRLAAQQLGIQQGVIDQSYAAELAATAHGSGLSRLVAGSKAERTIAGLGRAAAFMFRFTEKLNRVTVFDAAYTLGRDMARSTERNTKQYIDELVRRNGEFYEQLILEGWLHENAVGYLVARDSIERTMFEYSQWARPEFMRGKKGTLFTFFMFQQNMLWFARYSPGNKRYLALLFAAAGLLGLPLAEDLNDVIKAVVTKVMGKHFDPEVELRKVAAELTDRPDVIMRGLGRDTFGLRMLGDWLGIPIPGFDLSARVGMGRVVPGVEAATEPALDFDTRMARMVEDVIGASYGVPYNVVQGVAGFEPDNFKAYERLVPRALKNAIRGYRWLSEGEETTYSGATLRKFDPTDPESMLEVVGGALGFVPTGLRQQWDRAAAEREVARYWQAQRIILYDQFWRAARARDREAMADARNNIKQFNRETPFGGLRITADDLKSSLLARRRRQVEQEAGIPAQRGLIGAIRGTQEAFPEAPPLR